MINQPILDRIHLLVKQSRYKEAKEIIETQLSHSPEDYLLKYYYALITFQSGDNDEARILTEQLLGENPEQEELIDLSIKIDIEDKKFETAESKAKLLIELDPENADHHITMAYVKMSKRSYDKALRSVNKGLELDPENLNGLNLKIALDGLLGNTADTKSAIENALELDAEDPSSIANQAGQMLREGKVDVALDRLKYALSLDPNNGLAQYYMQEAIKSKFWPYRMFYKYKEMATRLSAKGSWKFIIATYVGYRILLSLARNNETLGPYLMPLVYIVLTLFLLTWIMDPLMNTYLLTNKYGRVLLDDNDKQMAQACSASLIVSILNFGLYILTENVVYFFGALIFVGCLIPLGSFLKPTKPSNRNITKFYSLVLVASAFVFVVMESDPILTLFAGGLFIYQFVINGILIKENARIFE